MTTAASRSGTWRTSMGCRSMSAFGAKETSQIHGAMSAYDPKRTSAKIFRVNLRK